MIKLTSVCLVLIALSGTAQKHSFIADSLNGWLKGDFNSGQIFHNRDSSFFLAEWVYNRGFTSWTDQNGRGESLIQTAEEGTNSIHLYQSNNSIIFASFGQTAEQIYLYLKNAERKVEVSWNIKGKLGRFEHGVACPKYDIYYGFQFLKFRNGSVRCIKATGLKDFTYIVFRRNGMIKSLYRLNDSAESLREIRRMKPLLKLEYSRRGLLKYCFD